MSSRASLWGVPQSAKHVRGLATIVLSLLWGLGRGLPTSSRVRPLDGFAVTAVVFAADAACRVIPTAGPAVGDGAKIPSKELPFAFSSSVLPSDARPQSTPSPYLASLRDTPYSRGAILATYFGWHPSDGGAKAGPSAGDGT